MWSPCCVCQRPWVCSQYSKSATCQSFGQGPLSHPLLVEAIEDLFVPLAIYNNREGEDAQVLKRYGEPSWNNPVVRFLGADGKDVIPRKDRQWSTHAVASRMVTALKSSATASGTVSGS